MMQELELRVFETSVPELADFGSFKLPVAYFANVAEDDPHRILSSPIIVDHQNAKLSIWSIHSPNNLLAVEEFIKNPEVRFEHADSWQWAHCFIPCPDGTYLTFFETSSLGIRFDPEKSKAYLFDAPEVFWKDSHARTFCVTAYANENPNADFFHTAFLRVSHDGIRQIVNVRLAYDFSSWEPTSVSSGDKFWLHAPHTSREIDGMVFNSFFNAVKYEVPEFPWAELWRTEFVEKAFLKAFMALQKIGWVSGEEMPESHFEIESGKIVFHSKVFESFITRLKNASWGLQYCDLICDKLLPWSRLAPGSVSYFRIGNGDEVFRARTTKGTPAHFEMSADRKTVYVSSHNFDVVCGCFKYFGPAAIDAFEITAGGLKKTGAFETPTGYRFTSHRAFEHGEKRYVATIGQPWRFFLVDGETMEEIFHADIIPSEIDSVPPSEMNAWIRLTNDYVKFTFFRPFEISEDGTTAFIPSETGLRYLSIFEPEKRFERIGFENLPPETFELLKKMKIINAHCYAVPMVR